MVRHYREQFRYDGPVADRGYPRDDVLVGPGSEQRRTAARVSLGLRERQTAVLYAPTWRDDQATNFRAARLHDGFDPVAAARALGDDHVVLMRGHRFHRDVDVKGPGVLDVSNHPEVNDLLLAADVAVLDYSSLRFDFALTGRPMVFCVPDLDVYIERRGFLFDFPDSAPGPLVGSTEEAVEALRDLPLLMRVYADARQRFHEEFNQYQDGHAAERVVEMFFGGDV
jgi:CDP-glycerol glycerophosphotransferase